MDIEEFEKQVEPMAKKSRLAPFQTQIFELKSKGYADWQIKDWLSSNGVAISRQAVQQFIKKGEKSKIIDSLSSPKNTGKQDLVGVEPTEEKGTSTDQSKVVPAFELVRPAGITNAAWNEMQVKHAKQNRK